MAEHDLPAMLGHMMKVTPGIKKKGYKCCWLWATMILENILLFDKEHSIDYMIIIITTIR